MIKILLPEKFEKIASTLKTIGYGKLIDDFILSMNQAAEKAAPQDEICRNSLSFDRLGKILSFRTSVQLKLFFVIGSADLPPHLVSYSLGKAQRRPFLSMGHEDMSGRPL